MKYLGLAILLCSIHSLTKPSLTTNFNEFNYSFAPEAGSDVPPQLNSAARDIIRQSSILYGDDVKKNSQNIHSKLLASQNSIYNVVITKKGTPNHQDQFTLYTYKHFYMAYPNRTDPTNPQWSYLLWRYQNFSKFEYLDHLGRGPGMSQSLYDLIQMYIQDNQQAGNCHAFALKDILTNIVPQQLWNVICQSTDQLQLTAYLSPKDSIWSVHSYFSKTKGNGHYLVWASYLQMI